MDVSEARRCISTCARTIRAGRSRSRGSWRRSGARRGTRCWCCAAPFEPDPALCRPRQARASPTGPSRHARRRLDGSGSPVGASAARGARVRPRRRAAISVWSSTCAASSPPSRWCGCSRRSDALGHDAELEVHHDRRPIFLYPQLDERGFVHETDEPEPGLVRIRIRQGPGVSISSPPGPAPALAASAARAIWHAPRRPTCWPRSASCGSRPSWPATTITRGCSPSRTLVTLGWVTLAIMGASYQLIARSCSGARSGASGWRAGSSGSLVAGIGHGDPLPSRHLARAGGGGRAAGGRALRYISSTSA